MTDGYELGPWDLSDLLPGPETPETDSLFKDLEDRTTALEGRRSGLTAGLSAADFIDLLEGMELLARGLNRLYGYAALKFAENTDDQAAQAFLARVEDFSARIQNRLLFFEIWWKNLDRETAERLLAVSGDRRYWLETMRRFKPHTLTEPEEKIINLKDVTGRSAWQTFYDQLTGRFVFRLALDGEVREITRGELMVYARHPDPALREAAYRELYRVYGADGPLLGRIYQTLIRDWKNEQLDLRRHASPMSARNLVNDLPDESVGVLLEVCRENAALFQRYFRLKAARLGLPSFRRYDLYAPVTKAERRYDFDQAVRLVLESFRDFDPALAGQAKLVLEKGHLDSQVRPGKRDGAFCASLLPGQAPWVLLSFQGRLDDLATLAHELGHAVHALLAAGHSLYTFEAPLPLAEMASTFGEMLLMDRLRIETSDADFRRDLAFRLLDDAYATISRQAFFSLFEAKAHDLTGRGATVDELASIYLEDLKVQFGPDVEVGDEFRWEWVSIPHFYHTPFYVYAYAFGQLLVLSLYQRYRRDRQSFKPEYLRLLAAGGSRPPVSLLAEAGLDVREASFWREGFQLLRAWLEDLETGGLNR
ncbi:MAG: M3 family oligoendopeptidase [Thermodesulfobacteriota bacterium]